MPGFCTTCLYKHKKNYIYFACLSVLLVCVQFTLFCWFVSNLRQNGRTDLAQILTQSMYILCLSVFCVFLYPINVKTAEPTRHKFCVGPPMTSGRATIKS